MDQHAGNKLRALPQVQRLLEMMDAALPAYPRPAVLAALRGVLAEARAALLDSDAPPPGAAEIVGRARAVLARRPGLRRVINATGIVLHTNLGRAPLAEAAVAAVASVAGGYCNLEFDLESGERGSRMAGAEPLLRRLTGAEAGLAVNNCAAAVLLALSGLAGDGGEVIVSRGELVEIGGGFRIPDVIRQGGAHLVEVGTTNKTRLDDYRGAVTPRTRVLLKVHRSNFRITGFTEDTPLHELAALARERDLVLVHDLGSGAATSLAGLGLPAEFTVQQSVASGADLVAFSGDKLLGGPQSGLLAGRASVIDRLCRHPLMRALRLDKMTLAALEATLRLHCDGDAAAIPVLRKLGQDTELLQARADRLASLIGAVARPQPTAGFAGGGTLPDAAIPSVGVALHGPDAGRLSARLRAGEPPVVGRIVEGSLLLDMLTVDEREVAELADAVRAALAE